MGSCTPRRWHAAAAAMGPSRAPEEARTLRLCGTQPRYATADTTPGSQPTPPHAKPMQPAIAAPPTRGPRTASPPRRGRRLLVERRPGHQAAHARWPTSTPRATRTDAHAPRRPLAVCCTRLRAAPVPALRCRQRARPRLRDRAWHNPDRAPAACPGAQAAMRRVGDAMARVVARRSARRGFWFASGGPEAEENGTTTRHAQSSRLRASPSLNEAARDRSRPSPSRSATSSPQPRCARARRRGRPGRGPHASPGAFGNATRHRQGAPPYLSRPRSCHTRRTDFSAPVAFARERARTFERTQSFQLHTPHPRTRSVRLVVRTPSACCVVARQNESE